MTKDYVSLIPEQNEMNKKLYLILSKVYLVALKERTPFKTGDTGARWELHIAGPYQFEFVNPNGEVVSSLEFGREPSIIKAKNKTFLKFKVPKSRKSTYKKIPGNVAFEKDGYVYAKMVSHPGFVGRHFIKQIMEDPALMSRFSEQMDKVIAHGR